MLNARIRKRWLKGGFKIALIGEKVDLTYDYDYLGAGPDSLLHFIQQQQAPAQKRIILVGQGALAREDGDAVLAFAAQAAQKHGGVGGDWNGLSILHTAAARVGALDLGFVPGAGGMRAHDFVKAGALDLIFNLGADEIDIAPGAFVVYIGSHGDRGAHRADVILPGAAYTEKSGLFVNTEGRVQAASRAAFPPGDAREDWAILRALSGALGDPLPFDSLTQLRKAMFAKASAFAAARRDRARRRRLGVEVGATFVGRDEGRFRIERLRFLSHQSDRARVGRHGRMFGAGQGPAATSRGIGVNDVTDGWLHTIVSFVTENPVLLAIYKSVLIAVVLLIYVAYVILADRKIWAAVQLRRGPNVVGPWGLWQSFADFIKFALKEPVIPDTANKSVFLFAPFLMATLAIAAWAVIPVSSEGWVVADINVGVLYIFALSSLGVYGVIMGGWASNSKYPFLSALRAAAQMVSYEVSIGFVIITVLLCAGSLNLTDIVQAQDTKYGMSRLVLAAPLADVRDLFRFRAGRDEPPAVRSRRSGIGTRRRLHDRIFRDALRSVHAGGICGDRDHVRAADDPFLRGLAAADQDGAFHLYSGRDLVHAEGQLLLLLLRDGESLRAPLSIRSIDASGLEGVFAALAGDGRHCGRRAAVWPRRRAGELR